MPRSSPIAAIISAESEVQIWKPSQNEVDQVPGCTPALEDNQQQAHNTEHGLDHGCDGEGWKFQPSPES